MVRDKKSLTLISRKHGIIDSTLTGFRKEAFGAAGLFLYLKSMKGSNNKNDISALEKENEELKKALELAMLNVAALETLVDVAEDQFNIQIRKKPGLGVPIRSTRSSFEIEPSYTFT